MNVAVYFRCSTDKQDKSIQDQRQVLEKYAKDHDLSITAWFDKDEGKSGTNFEKRPDFMRMVRLVESGKHDFDQILVYDVDRWGRPIDPDESSYWEFHFKRYGVQVIYVLDSSLNDNSMAGRLTKSIKQELATEESRKQSLRVRERSKSRAAEGFRVGGFAPYGFKRQLVDSNRTPIRLLEDGERKAEKSQRVVLVLGDPREVDVVKQIYELKSSGRGVRAIANYLNAKGIPAPSARRVYSRKTPAKWSINSVWRILRSRLYRGDWVYNRQLRGHWVRHENPGATYRAQTEHIVAHGAHPAIVSQEMYESVNREVQSIPRLRPSGMSYRSDYLLSGLIKCSHCGYNFQGHTRTAQGKRYQYYEDSGHNLHGNSVCTQTLIPRDRLETFILVSLREKLTKAADRKRLESLLKATVRTLLKPDDTAATIRNQIREVERKIENLKDSLEQGVDIKFVADRLRKLDLEKDQLSADLVKEATKVIQVESVDSVVTGLMEQTETALRWLETGNPQRMKDALRMFVDRVEVSPSDRNAVFYVNRLPYNARTLGDSLSVSACRRSGLHPDFNGDWLIVSVLKVRAA